MAQKAHQEGHETNRLGQVLQVFLQQFEHLLEVFDFAEADEEGEEVEEEVVLAAYFAGV